MLEASLYRSPFEGHVPGDRPSRSGQLGIKLVTRLLHQVALIGTWPSELLALYAVLDQALGGLVPQKTGQTAQTPWGLLIHCGPEEFLLVDPQGQDLIQRLRRVIPASVGSVTDLSHARVCVTLEGDCSPQLLSKLFALDIRQQSFAAGEVRLTGHHHLPTLLHRRSETVFDLYLFTTYAHDQLATLLDAGLEYGVRLESLA